MAPPPPGFLFFFTVGEEVALVLQGFLFVFTVGEAVAPPRAFLRLWMQQLSVRPVTWSLG